MNGAYRELAFNLIPWVREKLLVSEAELVVVLVEVKDDNINLVASLYKL